MMKTEPKVVLIVTFGTIARADVIAEDLVEAIKRLEPDFPIVTAIRGTGEEKVRDLLGEVGLEPLEDTEEAVEKAIELAGSAER
jgi:succinyl-CoA synthetase beta subunit